MCCEESMTIEEGAGCSTMPRFYWTTEHPLIPVLKLAFVLGKVVAEAMLVSCCWDCEDEDYGCCDGRNFMLLLALVVPQAALPRLLRCKPRSLERTRCQSYLRCSLGLSLNCSAIGSVMSRPVSAMPMIARGGNLANAGC